MLEHDPIDPPSLARLLPVLPLKDLCLFPDAMLSVLVRLHEELVATDIACRTGGLLLALGQKPAGDLYGLGTVARVEPGTLVDGGGRMVALEGLGRARVRTLVGAQLLVAEVEAVDEGDAGENWGPAVEILARYLFAHPDLREFVERQRRSGDPMAWVNLACQHLPITASARQRLLEADAAQRCTMISKGMDALLRKEQLG